MNDQQSVEFSEGVILYVDDLQTFRVSNNPTSDNINSYLLDKIINFSGTENCLSICYSKVLSMCILLTQTKDSTKNSVIVISDYFNFTIESENVIKIDIVFLSIFLYNLDGSIDISIFGEFDSDLLQPDNYSGPLQLYDNCTHLHFTNVMQINANDTHIQIKTTENELIVLKNSRGGQSMQVNPFFSNTEFVENVSLCTGLCTCTNMLLQLDAILYKSILDENGNINFIELLPKSDSKVINYENVDYIDLILFENGDLWFNGIKLPGVYLNAQLYNFNFTGYKLVTLNDLNIITVWVDWYAGKFIKTWDYSMYPRILSFEITNKYIYLYTEKSTILIKDHLLNAFNIHIVNPLNPRGHLNQVDPVDLVDPVNFNILPITVYNKHKGCYI